jgi:hypothetical protein
MTAWNDLVSKIYKENKGTKNADGKDFSLKDAMILAKKSYKSGDKTKKSKKGGSSHASPVSATHTAAVVAPAPAPADAAPAVTKGGRRKKRSSSKKRSSKRKNKTAKKSRKSRK